jgi:hypothetical protein
MAVTQREYDIMQLQAQLRIRQIVEDWKRQFMSGRLQQQGPAQSSTEEQVPPQMPPGGGMPYA